MSDTTNSYNSSDALAPHGERTDATPAPAEAKTLRVASWNMFSGKHYGGHYDPAALQRSVNELESDVVCLQEVDRSMMRTRWHDTAQKAADAVGFEAHFGRTRRRLDGGSYGNAILTAPTVEPHSFKNIQLPRIGWNERRNVIFMRLGTNDAQWSVANTHLSNDNTESERQLRWLLGYLSEVPGPRVLMGDMNRKEDDVFPLLEESGWKAVDTGPTWSSSDPQKRIDWMFVNGATEIAAEVKSLEVSDHCAVIATLRSLT